MKTLNDPTRPVIVWFRRDLRLGDNPALHFACTLGPVIPVFIWAPHEEKPWEPGTKSRAALKASVSSLEYDLKQQGSQLVYFKGDSGEILQKLAARTNARMVVWNELYEPAVRQQDHNIFQALRASGIECQFFNGNLLHEPAALLNSSGGPFQVFTAFWRRLLNTSIPTPLPSPRTIRNPEEFPQGASLEDLGISHLKFPGSARGEVAAQKMLKTFLRHALRSYSTDRDFPELAGTSKLSSCLHFGEISPRQIKFSLEKAGTKLESNTFFKELIWREFSHYLLFHFPHTAEKPLRPEFNRFQWRKDPEMLKAWQAGATGYPMVDAGMRELAITGSMHNRARMITASFLVKDLQISWLEGARWFWENLEDADLAQNTLGWQWTAGCGADAAPFFRIFNPVTQGRKFDPDGTYVRKWVPELSKLPGKWIHQPWEAPAELLAKERITLGLTYPLPIVSHSIAREVSLEKWTRMRMKTK